MFGFRFMKGAAVSLATLGMMAPQMSLLAETPAAKRVTANVNSIPDIVMSESGTMNGRVCDHNGKVIEGAKVVLKQDNKIVGTTVTNNDGIYSFKNLKGGVYYPSAGNTEGVFRVWSKKSAPPSAKEHALLVMGENGTRGQFGGADPALIFTAAGLIAVTTISLINTSKINSLSNQIDDLQKQVVSP